MDLTDLLQSPERLSKEAREEAHSASYMPVGEEDPRDFGLGQILFHSGAIDDLLQGRTMQGAQTTALQDLTDGARKSNALKVPVLAGTRVKFVANLGSVLAYNNIPEDGTEGTVVTVRSADGDGTVWNDRVMVAWDDGVFRPIGPEHLRQAKQTRKRGSYEGYVRVRVGSLGDLSSYFGPSKHSTTDLIHHATKDLWSFQQEEGGYVIQRLFNEDGNPLKV